MVRLCSFALAVLFVACTNTNQPSDPNSPNLNNNASSGVSPDELAQGGDCVAPTGSGTTHAGTIAGVETWKAVDGPHHITSSLSITGTLTIEACVRVLLSEGVRIDVGGSSSTGAKLVTEGSYTPEKGTTPEVIKPVVFTSATDGKHWGAIFVWDKNEAVFNVTALIQGGDKDAVAFDYSATLVGRGPNNGLLNPTITANTLLVLESGGVGIALRSGSGFKKSDSELEGVVVLNAGKQQQMATSNTDFDLMYPVVVEPPGIGTLPPGVYLGGDGETLGKHDMIVVALPSQILGDSETFKNFGVPYLMTSDFYLRPATAEGATFTVEAGTELRFKTPVGGSIRYGMQLGDGGGVDGRPVKIDIQGTADKPVLFTSDAEVPAPGDWMGLLLDYAPATGNKLTHTTIAYAGAESGHNSYGCGPKDNDSAILITDWRPDDAFIQNVTIKHSAGGGIMSGWASNADGPNLKVGNTFEAIGNGCEVSKWRLDEVNYCPGRTDENPLCL